MIRRSARALALALLVGLTPACGSDCPPPPGGACPAPAPAAGKVEVGGLLDGITGGKGSAKLTIPGYGETSVSLTCDAVTVKKDTPAAGTTQVKLSCKFSKFPGISGTIDVTIEIDAAGKGSITATGRASIPIVGEQNINVSIDLNGGSQTEQTISLDVTVNGKCSKATIKRDGDKIIIEVEDPVTRIEITKK